MHRLPYITTAFFWIFLPSVLPAIPHPHTDELTFHIQLQYHKPTNGRQHEVNPMQAITPWLRGVAAAVNSHAVSPRALIPKGTKVAFFAGQGFLRVGMGGDTANSSEVRELYARASKVLGHDLLHIVLNGPLECTTTEGGCVSLVDLAQPAILVSTYAAVRRYADEHGQRALADFGVATGFSVGEYAALVFADVLRFEDAVKLVHLRGNAMKQASSLSSQAMITVDGPPAALVKDICSSVSASSPGVGSVQIGNYLADTLNVISGDSVLCHRVVDELRTKHLELKATQLDVLGAFHTDYMKPAEQTLQRALNEVKFSDARIPVVSNFDGVARTNGEEIRQLMLKQLTNPVQMHASLKLLLEHDIFTGTEFGPKSGLGAMLKRVAKASFPSDARKVAIANVL